MFWLANFKLISGVKKEASKTKTPETCLFSVYYTLSLYFSNATLFIQRNPYVFPRYCNFLVFRILFFNSSKYTILLLNSSLIKQNINFEELKDAHLKEFNEWLITWQSNLEASHLFLIEKSCTSRVFILRIVVGKVEANVEDLEKEILFMV